MARYRRPFHSPNSITLTMFGWDSSVVTLASCSKPLYDLVVADELRMQQLHRDRRARRDLLGAIHTAHAPVPDHLEELKRDPSVLPMT
jgi:hypothetical protein